MKRRLSSAINPIYKLSPLFGFGFDLYWLTVDFRAERLPAGFFFLLGWGLLAKLSSRLKAVYLAGDALYVSNYLRRVRIPLTEVAAVKESSFLGGKQWTVVVELRGRSEFGERIVFIPRWFGFAAHDIAEEIRYAIALQPDNSLHPTADTKALK